MPMVLVDARDAYLEPLRGWGRYARELVEHLAPDDLEVRTVTRGGRGPEVLFEQVELPRIARRLGANLVHAPNCFLPLRRPCPGVVTIHDLAFEALPGDFSRKTGAKYRWATPRAARSAERVVCVSQWTADDVVARYDVDPSKLRVVPNAPSLPVGDGPVPASVPVGDRGYVMAIGDLRPKKNLPRLVEAWRRADTGRALVLVGAGTWPDGAPPEGVVLTGYLPDAELDALLRGADLLVHPSLYEGFGLVVVEAMVRGTPVACADATALPETAGGAAQLFDPLDVDAMAGAISAALADRERLSAAGRARAADFSWERTAALTADVYREALAA
ncbi:glycosyltransferase family 1 protein [Conexibacter sp. SYSU D00693]|uniref:glycosyltransferase family 4 protein n=1 Tax=Conexibacter sp. SYSU D00693 TaxID=2812560 RepID=UPI00196ADDFA|nr:glycosyltransferase family 1 protein [Conexibacter sp. SYSU D00693]